ncbi:hypothetical protein JTE90_017245 [Oedothorax gibbosus]|uniref:Uncharacterized protein n=1 Tax=Oedothorax gibbosus TaxID=931172 RepID=A0AAV6VE20_9ARAC|nr:hypothetical protein JTE90_017245 [Oedothorax gibbosus]
MEIDNPNPDEGASGKPRLRKSGCSATGYFESPLSSIISKSSVLKRDRNLDSDNSRLHSRLDNLRERSPKGRTSSHFDIADVKATTFDSLRKTSIPAKSNVSPPPVLRSKMLSTTLPPSYRVSDKPPARQFMSSFGQAQLEPSTRDISLTSLGRRTSFEFGDGGIHVNLTQSAPVEIKPADTSVSKERRSNSGRVIETPTKVSTEKSLFGSTRQLNFGEHLTADRFPSQPKSPTSPLSDSGFEEFKALHSRMVRPEGRQVFKASRQLSTSLTTLDDTLSSGQTRKSEPSKRYSAILSYGPSKVLSSGGSSPSRSPTMNRQKFDLKPSNFDDFDSKEVQADKETQNVFLQKYLTKVQKDNNKSLETKKLGKSTLPIIPTDKSSLRKSETDLASTSISKNRYGDSYFNNSYNDIKAKPSSSQEWSKLPPKSNSEESYYKGSASEKLNFPNATSELTRSLSDSEKASSPPVTDNRYSFRAFERTSISDKMPELPRTVSKNIFQESDAGNNGVLHYESFETPLLKERNTQSRESIADCTSKILGNEDQKVFGSANYCGEFCKSYETPVKKSQYSKPLFETTGLFKTSANLRKSNLSSGQDLYEKMGNSNSSNKYSISEASDSTGKKSNEVEKLDEDSEQIDDEPIVEYASSSDDQDFSKLPLVLYDNSSSNVKPRSESNWEVTNLNDCKVTDDNEDSEMRNFKNIMNFNANRSQMMGTSMKEFQKSQTSFSDLSQINSFAAECRQEKSNQSKIDSFSTGFQQERSRISAEHQIGRKTSTFKYSNIENEDPISISKNERTSAFRSSKKCSSSFDSSEFRDSFDDGGNWKCSIAQEPVIKGSGFPKRSEFKDFSSGSTSMFGEKVNQENRVYSEVSSKSSNFRTEQTKRSVILNRKSTTVTRRLRIGRTVRTTSRYTR